MSVVLCEATPPLFKGGNATSTKRYLFRNEKENFQLILTNRQHCVHCIGKGTGIVGIENTVTLHVKIHYFSHFVVKNSNELNDTNTHVKRFSLARAIGYTAKSVYGTVRDINEGEKY